MIDRDDLRFEVERLSQQLDAMERRQRLANSRIRQDITVGITTTTTAIGIGVIAYSGWPTWAYFALFLAVIPAYQSLLMKHVRNQEEPK